MAFFVAIIFTSCEDYFGNKTDLDFIEIPTQNYREVAYVPVQPVLDNFVRPTDVLAGLDELIYVVDNATEEIIALDESGRELGRKKVPGVKSITQDRKLDILAVGTINTIQAGNVPYTLSCIYRLDLSTAFGYGIQYAQFTDTIIHPFYFKTSFLARDADVQFNRIAAIGNNQFYVSRQGPRNSITQLNGPDNAILLFDEDGTFVTPITVTTNDGRAFRDYFKSPFGISTLAKPPQINASASKDFIFTSIDNSTVLKVQYIEYIESDFGSQYTPKQMAAEDTAEADGFLNTPYKFSEPVGVTITGDGTNYIFVADSEKDSVYQFTNTGYEGVNPPPASGRTKFVKTSFGGSGIELNQFNEPMAVAYSNKILYVADAGNGRVLRFKLTLDIR